MKEIIYIDNKLIDSLLAQLNKGLLTKLIDESGDVDTNSENAISSASTSGNLGINIGLVSNLNRTATETINSSAVFSKTNKI